MAKDLEKSARDVEAVEVGTPVIQEATLHIDEFLRGVEGNRALNAMFRHFHVVVKGIEKATKKEFEKMYEAFKTLPASKLK